MLFSLMACEKQQDFFTVKLVDNTGIYFEICEVIADGHSKDYADDQFNAGILVKTTSDMFTIRLVDSNSKTYFAMLEVQADCQITITYENQGLKYNYTY